MKRYEWLRDELAAVKTPRFHMIDGPSEIVTPPGLVPPSSYREFIAEFGQVRLYRKGNAYLIGVYARLQEAVSKSGKRLVRFGHYYDSRAFFQIDDLGESAEPPVYEASPGLRRIAPSFEDWLERRARSARASYKKGGWASIVSGPKPFTKEEEDIIEARAAFRWRVLDSSPDGWVRFEVHNGSGRTLPFLSIGVRGPNFLGGMKLSVAGIAPGTTGVLSARAYRGYRPDQLQYFDLSRPRPEDRSMYWEFRALKPS
jgi:hypothetical protein